MQNVVKRIPAALIQILLKTWAQTAPVAAACLSRTESEEVQLQVALLADRDSKRKDD
jgi:hypothetical protein